MPTFSCVARVEKALRQPNGMSRVAQDMGSALEQLASSDYTGSALLQLKKQVRK
jgi:hypothetical protein